LKLLVVDDDEFMREHLVTILRHEGFEPLVANNGRIGLEMARLELPDLILSDVMMPELDGYALLEALRADPLTSGIPFIFLTASTNRMDRRRGMNLGADDYIGKPFSHDEVRDAVMARLKRSQTFERSAPTVDLASPSLIQIKGYRVTRRLGGGGMSEVFLAIRERDGLEVALKLLDTRVNQNASLLHRFIQECALLEQINHTNVARIFDHGFTDTHAFIAMEYFEHGDIRSRIASGLSPYESLAIVVQVALALSQIHALGIVHRDVKPDNLMLRANGSVALIDFGIAKLADQPLDQTQHGEIVGSPYYMSPEQALGQAVSPASDIYCLGVIFFELVTGNRPYVADVMESLLYQHVNAPRPQFEPKFADFQGLLDRMMHKNPEKRFASGQAAVEFVARYWPPVIKQLKGKSLPEIKA
jgi:serine/threonine protein kinase